MVKDLSKAPLKYPSGTLIYYHYRYKAPRNQIKSAEAVSHENSTRIWEGVKSNDKEEKSSMVLFT